MKCSSFTSSFTFFPFTIVTLYFLLILVNSNVFFNKEEEPKDPKIKRIFSIFFLKLTLLKRSALGEEAYKIFFPSIGKEENNFLQNG